MRTVFFTILLAGTGFAQAGTTNTCVSPDDWQAIVTEGKTRSRVSAHLDHLANRIGPRLTGSDGCTVAAHWARDTFRSFGIENARLEQWGTQRVGFNRGPWSGAIVAPESARKNLHFCTNAWTAGTRGKQRGGIVFAPKNLKAARERRAELAGKWLLSRGGGSQFRMFAGPNIKLNSFLVEAGALGVIRSARNNLLVTSGSRNQRWNRLPKLPDIILRKDEFTALVAQVEAGDALELEFDIRNHFKKGPIPLYNVIADITGTEKPDEYVVIGGHLDSWDGATGTTDNGTGTATTLEAARILMACGVKPKRTIRFMLWTGEEQGLLGSVAWCRKHRKLVKEKVSGCFVHDGGTNYVSGIQAFKNQLPVIRKAFAGFETIDKTYRFTIDEATGVMPGSDHYAFHQAGAPGFFWMQDGKANYTWTHHTQHDTFDAAIEPYQKHTATVAALAALAVANLDVMIPRPPKGAGMSMSVPISMVGIHLSKDMVVTEVRKNSRGAQMGLEKGDKLVSLEGKKLGGGEKGFMSAIMRWVMSGKAKGSFVLVRDGKETKLEIPNPMAAGK